MTRRTVLAGARPRKLALGLVAGLTAVLLCAPAALAGVSWQVTMTHANLFGRLGARDPYALSAKTFARESASDLYAITVQNVGSQASSDGPTLSDVLPPGVTLMSPVAVEQFTGSPWGCAQRSAGSSFECKSANTVAAGEALPPILAEVMVGAQAAPPADEVATVTNVATVSGGGGASAQTSAAEGQTTIVPAVPFGLEGFAVHVGEFENKPVPSKNVNSLTEGERLTLLQNIAPGEELEFTETDNIRRLESLFTPEDQAGGHPASLTNDFAYNFRPFIEKWAFPPGNREGLEGEKGELSEVQLELAGGKAKELQVELPPGFVGNVLGRPRCEGIGPLDCAVGYLDVNVAHPGYAYAATKEEEIPYLPYQPGEEPQKEESTGGTPQPVQRQAGRTVRFLGSASTAKRGKAIPGEVEPLPTRALIYNDQPTPGNPAQFDFTVASSVISLEVKLRSDGDYGVTVGNSAQNAQIPPWDSVHVTMCEWGVEASSFPALQKGEGALGAAGKAWYHCKPPPTPEETEKAGEKPFLTNPTECSAPVWTARTDSYAEPASYKSKSVGVNGTLTRVTRAKHEELAEGTAGELVEVSPHALDGCEKLRFEPDLSFGPGVFSQAEGATTQADEPTGAEVDLQLPQEEGAGDATPELKLIEMKLPEGMSISPSAANGLQTCARSQFWPARAGEAAPAEHREPAVSANCPHASQIATVEVFTPLLSGQPSATGPTQQIGGGEQTLSCAPGMWSGGPWTRASEQRQAGAEELENGKEPNNGSHERERLTVSYQWLGDRKLLQGPEELQRGGRSSQYVIGAADAGKAMQCQVTARNAGGSSAAVSLPVFLEPQPAATPIPPASIAPPVNLTHPGTLPAPGDALECQTGQWTGLPESSKVNPFTYTWLRDGVPIAAATAASYTLTAADAGQVIQCQIAGQSGVVTALADSAAVTLAPSASTPPLPGGALQGEMFVGQPECSPCTNEDAEDGRAFPLFIQASDALGLPLGSPGALLVKLHGASRVNAQTGRVTSVFTDQPQQPFDLFKVDLEGGPRAPLANPQTCAPARTETTLEPWSAPQTHDVTSDSPYTVDWNGAGAPCPATLPFAPSFNAGTATPSAGANTSFSVTFARQDREQDLASVAIHMPPGLAGKIPDVTLCTEAQALAQQQEAPTEGHAREHCPAASQIGTAVSLAGPGPDPYKEEGQVYLTGPLKSSPGAPFNVLIDTPAESPVVNLGHVVVLSAITVNPETAAVTVTTPQLPQIVSGVPIRLREVHVEVNRPGFMINPTNCSAQQLSASFGGNAGAGASASSPFGISGCKNLPFKPTFTATTQAHTSKEGGASLDVKVTYPPGAYANIAKTVTDLPIQLPSRLTTIQKACVDKVFEANPAACDPGSVIGEAVAKTPVLNSQLRGPAYLISHGGRAFPDIEIVLQGEGVTIVLDGHTDIKKGVTKTTFESLPDSPVESFELILPEGPHSALAAPENLCEPTRTVTVKESVAVRRKGHVVHVKKNVTKRVAEKLLFPTKLVGQNGAVIKQTTVIGVQGCPPTVEIVRTKLEGNALLVTVKTSAKGTLRLTGAGLRTKILRNLAPGTHQIKLKLTARGRSLRARHKKTKLRASLTAGRQIAAKGENVKL